MTARLLPLPADPRFQAAIDGYADFAQRYFEHPRSSWLTYFEGMLHNVYPQASSADRKLTARHYAPFPLAAGHDVP